MTKYKASYSHSKYIPDELDRRLIALLRQDGRASLAKLADILKVSRGTVQNRLDRMVDNGTISNFTIRVRADYDDNAIHSIMLIEVVGKSTNQVIRQLRGIAAIQTLHTTNGNWDIVASITTDNLAEFDRVLGEIRSIDGVLNSETSILLSSVS